MGVCRTSKSWRQMPATVEKRSMSPQTKHEADSSQQDDQGSHGSAVVSRTWKARFCDAGRGVASAVRGERSFRVDLTAAVLVVVVAGMLRVSTVEWAVLLTCSGAVIAAETFNSSIESLAKAVTHEQHADVGRALDRAAGAVLLVSLGAAAAGLSILVPHLIGFFSN